VFVDAIALLKANTGSAVAVVANVVVAETIASCLLTAPAPGEGAVKISAVPARTTVDAVEQVTDIEVASAADAAAAVIVTDVGVLLPLGRINPCKVVEAREVAPVAMVKVIIGKPLFRN
jgi:hypothetical protein